MSGTLRAIQILLTLGVAVPAAGFDFLSEDREISVLSNPVNPGAPFAPFAANWTNVVSGYEAHQTSFFGASSFVGNGFAGGPSGDVNVLADPTALSWATFSFNVSDPVWAMLWVEIAVTEPPEANFAFPVAARAAWSLDGPVSLSRSLNSPQHVVIPSNVFHENVLLTPGSYTFGISALAQFFEGASASWQVHFVPEPGTALLAASALLVLLVFARRAAPIR